MMLQDLVLLLFFQQTIALLEIDVPDSHSTSVGSTVVIPCKFRVDANKVDQQFLAIFWEFQGKQILSYDDIARTVDPRASIDTKAAVNGIASLSISNVKISDVGLYKCSVLYSPVIKGKEIRLDVQAVPKLTISNSVVVKDTESVLSSTVTGFYPVDIDIKWLRDGEMLNNIRVGKPERNADGTYQVHSFVVIIPTEGNQDQTFTCRVQHGSLNKPLQEDFKLVYGAVPSIHMSLPTFVMNQETTVVCTVWGFYPETISVKWFLNSTLEKTSTLKKLNSSALESSIQFLPTPDRQPEEFSCVVEHKTLSGALVKKLVVDPKDFRTEDIASNTIIIGSSIGTILAVIVIIVLFAVCWCKKKRSLKKDEEHDCGMPSLAVGNIQIMETDTEVKFQCEISNIPKSTRQPVVTWSRKENGSDFLLPTTNNNYRRPASKQENQSDGTFTCTEMLVCTEKQSLCQGTEFICTVTHENLKFPVEKRTELLQLKDMPSLKEGNIQIMDTDTEVKLECEISNIPKSTAQPVVTWSRKEKGSDILLTTTNKNDKRPPTTQKNQSDGTDTCREILVCTEKQSLCQGTESIGTVTHENLKLPVEKRTEPLQLKDMPSLEEGNIQIMDTDTEVKLECEISNIPKSTAQPVVTWSRKNGSDFLLTTTNKNDKRPPTTQKKQSDGTDTCTEMLVCTENQSLCQGTESICTVTHENLKLPVEKRTEPLQLKGLRRYDSGQQEAEPDNEELQTETTSLIKKDKEETPKTSNKQASEDDVESENEETTPLMQEDITETPGRSTKHDMSTGATSGDALGEQNAEVDNEETTGQAKEGIEDTAGKSTNQGLPSGDVSVEDDVEPKDEKTTPLLLEDMRETSGKSATRSLPTGTTSGGASGEDDANADNEKTTMQMKEDEEDTPGKSANQDFPSGTTSGDASDEQNAEVANKETTQQTKEDEEGAPGKSTNQGATSRDVSYEEDAEADNQETTEKIKEDKEDTPKKSAKQVTTGFKAEWMCSTNL
ncbi:uncharacterized protein O3C94_018986 [Discoglossus pictus]